MVVLVAAILVGACTHAHRGGQAGAARNAAASLSGPVQKAATALTDWMERIYASRFRYDQLAEENEALRRQYQAELEAEARYAKLAARAGEQACMFEALARDEGRHAKTIYCILQQTL